MTAKAEIAELVNNWAFYRDQERWEELSSVFHPGGTISISWYDGPHEGFVEASKMIASRGGALLKHQLGVPSIRVAGARAASEVNVAIYEKDRIDPVDMAHLPDAVFQGLDEFPAELRFLAAGMKRGGVDLSRSVVLDRSPEAKALYAERDAWLAAE